MVRVGLRDCVQVAWSETWKRRHMSPSHACSALQHSTHSISGATNTEVARGEHHKKCLGSGDLRLPSCASTDRQTHACLCSGHGSWQIFCYAIPLASGRSCYRPIRSKVSMLCFVLDQMPLWAVCLTTGPSRSDVMLSHYCSPPRVK
jgi:hypothetical protein